VRFLVFPRQAGLLRHHDEVLLELAARGHELEVAFPRSRGQALRPPLAGAAGISERQFDEGWDGDTARALRLLRLARDYLRFLEPPLDVASVNRRRALDRFVTTLSGGGRGLDPSWPDPAVSPSGEELAGAKDAIARIEALLPPDPGVERFVADRRPDAVLVTPLVSLGSEQTEVVKAASALGIPCGLLVFSWDNLSNKGVMAAIPDRVFVWNELQKREAVELHGVPERAVVVTGAPRFDRFFESRPSVTREQLCGGYGLDPGRPLIVYLASAPIVSPDERVVADRWLAALRAAPDERLAGAGVIVRPHPRRRVIWDDWHGRDAPGVAVSEKPDVQGDQGLYDQLYHAAAAVGLNTSAELEASILGTPVCTFDDDVSAPGQRGTMHFYYLLRERGGVVEHARTLQEHLEQLGRAVAGDYDAAAIRAFVESFVRPAGIERPAVPILAGAIEELARPERAPRRTPVAGEAH
jgi:hypothetical protein